MKLFVAILSALAVFLAPLLAQAPVQSQMLLGRDVAWRKQSGEWTIAEGSAAASASGTLSEYAASSGVSLKGRWLSVRVALEGDSAKAGLWLAGLRDEKGDLVRLTIDATSGVISNGRGRSVAALPSGAVDKPLDFVLKFSGDAMSIHFGGAEIGGFKVSFEDANPTPSLFVERGRATFSDFIVGGEPAKALVMQAAPVRLPVVAKAVVVADFAVDFSEAKMTALKSEWRAYFGVHAETAPGPWKTVRQFDGPSSGLPLKPLAPGKRLDGPFNGTPVEMDLAWFRDTQKRTSLGLDRNLPMIVGNDMDAVFIAPWRTILGKTLQDQIWALMKLAYSASPGVEKRLFFQWGDDINMQRLGTLPIAKLIQATPHHGMSYKRLANQPADAIAYAENFFAPAVEAVRKASSDVFGEPGRIPVMIGSCSRAGLDENRDWFRTVLEHSIAGEMAPSLRGKRVIDLVDYITVNHPFADAQDTKTLQALWNSYGKRVKGLWITEEFGSVGRISAHLTNRVALFFQWVAANDLDAQQARMIWDFVARKRGSDDCVGLMLQLAESMNGALRFGMDANETGTLYRISAGAGRLLIVYTPVEKKGVRAIPVGQLAIEVGEDRAKNPWLARLVAGSVRQGVNDVIPIRVDGSRLLITPKATTSAPWAVLVETP